MFNVTINFIALLDPTRYYVSVVTGTNTDRSSGERFVQNELINRGSNLLVVVGGTFNTNKEGIGTNDNQITMLIGSRNLDRYISKKQEAKTKIGKIF